MIITETERKKKYIMGVSTNYWSPLVVIMLLYKARRIQSKRRFFGNFPSLFQQPWRSCVLARIGNAGIPLGLFPFLDIRPCLDLNDPRSHDCAVPTTVIAAQPH